MKSITYEFNNSIWRASNNVDKKISNFVIRFIARFKSSSGEYWCANITNDLGFESSLIISDRHLRDVRQFRIAIVSRGNFVFIGNKSDLLDIIDRLGSIARDTILVDKLGWNQAGFYAFVNGIIPCDNDKKQFLQVDNWGLVSHKDISYFIPGGSCVFADNECSYIDEKKFVFVENEKVESKAWLELFCLVHKSNAPIALAYFLASLFRDIIFSSVKRFPILYLYGPPGAGKSEIANSLLSMFGQPQSPVYDEMCSPFALSQKCHRFNNALVFVEEYHPNRSKVFTEVLSCTYDGHSSSELEKKQNSLKHFPATSGIAVASQDLPVSNVRQLMRCIILMLDEGRFSDIDRTVFSNLKDFENTPGGLTAITAEFLQLRQSVELKFTPIFKRVRSEFRDKLPEADERDIYNIGILFAILEIFSEVVDFPFSLKNARENMIENIVNQSEFLKSPADL